MDLDIKKLISDKFDIDKNKYRSLVRSRFKFSWNIIYRNSDLIISSDKNISNRIMGRLEEIYKSLDFCIESEPAFLKSLSPIKIKPFFPSIIKKMCRLSAEFNVGPMAAVAGTVNEYLAFKLLKANCDFIIENGGDLYIKSKKDICVGVYVKNTFFKDRIVLKIKAKNTPCGLCSSSGVFGHSYSLGKCDLAVVMSKSCITADAAATAVANSVSSIEDVEKSINYFKEFDSIIGLLIIKDNKLGVWGMFEL